MSFAYASTSVWNRRGLGNELPLRFRVLPGWRLGRLASTRRPSPRGARAATLQSVRLLVRGRSAVPSGTRLPAGWAARSSLH